MLFRRLGLTIVAILWAAALCLAQLDTASIVGTVIDSSGAVIPGAKVQVQNMGTGATVELITSGNGNFVAPVLSIGNYKVTVSMAGFGTYVRENIRLNVADRVGLTVELKPGPVTQQVTVVGERPVVETASTTLGGVVSSQQVTNLPLNGRALTQLLVTIPGVSMLGVEGSINGAGMGRLFETASRLLLDGTDSGQVDSDLPDGGYGTHARMTRASVESIAEVRVQENSFSAEYGQSIGGVINFITKSGTNNFHGSLFEYFRNEKLDARNPFNVLQAKPPFRLNQYGGSLGGPIKKEKAFFFVNYEGVRQRLGSAYMVVVPSAAYRAALLPVLQPPINTLPLPNSGAYNQDYGWYNAAFADKLREDTFAVKIDYNFTSKDRLSARYNLNDSFTYVNFGVGKGQAIPDPFRTQIAKFSYTRTFSSTLLNELGLGINRMYAVPASASEEDVRKSPMVWIFASMIPNIGPSLWDMRVGNMSETYLDTLSWVKGRHQLKFGTQIVRNQVNKETYFERLILFLGAGNGILEYGSNIPYEIATFGNPTSGQRETMMSFFVLDDLQATRNLTLNLGLRYQFDTVPTEAHGRNTNFDIATGKLDSPGTALYVAPKLNFGPRFAFAWNAIPSKQFVIRGGYGIYFMSTNPAVSQFMPTNNRDFSYYRAETIFDKFLTGFPPTDITDGPMGFVFTPMPRDTKAAYTQNWNFNLQKGIGQSTVLHVAYVANVGRHLSGFYDPNRIDPVTHTRPFPDYGSMTQFWSCCNSSYNSLQVSLRHRFSHGLTFNVNYTWAHSFDQSEWAYGTQPQNDHRLDLEKASADYDIRHLLQFDYTYQLPAAPGIPKWLGSGWQINGLTVMRSGTSVNVIWPVDVEGTGSVTWTKARPNVVAGVSPRPANYSIPFNQINYAAFSDPGSHFGNLGRNTLKGPAVFNWDFSLFKNFKVREGHELQFRAEMFNIFNTPQYAAPAADFSNPATFGKSLTTINAAGGFGSNRQMQFALKYIF